eukprot:475209-Pleurochrysis_carterae.AAC.1
MTHSESTTGRRILAMKGSNQTRMSGQNKQSCVDHPSCPASSTTCRLPAGQVRGRTCVCRDDCVHMFATTCSRRARGRRHVRDECVCALFEMTSATCACMRVRIHTCSKRNPVGGK